MEKKKLHVVFVCSHNQWRSPTAERMFAQDPRMEVRSAGTSERAKHPISFRDVAWADLLLCMEDKHAEMLMERFGRDIQSKIRVLHIDDEYQYKDPRLIAILEQAVEEILTSM